MFEWNKVFGYGVYSTYNIELDEKLFMECIYIITIYIWLLFRIYLRWLSNICIFVVYIMASSSSMLFAFCIYIFTMYSVKIPIYNYIRKIYIHFMLYVDWKVCKYKKIGRKEKKIDPISLGYQPEYFYFSLFLCECISRLVWMEMDLVSVFLCSYTHIYINITINQCLVCIHCSSVYLLFKFKERNIICAVCVC